MKHRYNPLAVSSDIGETLTARGVATTPAASADIVTLAAPPAGRYVIEVAVNYAGTAPAAVEDGNWKLRFNNADYSQLATARVVGVQQRFRFVVTLNGTHPVILRANALGTTGTVYNGQIIAQQIE